MEVENDRNFWHLPDPMKFKHCVLLLVALVFTVLTPRVEASCRALFEDSEQGMILKEESGARTLYGVDAAHKQLDGIIEEILKIQQSLLVNRLDPEKVAPELINGGFLVTQMAHSELKDLLRDGKILGICDGSGSGDVLAGYLILTPLTSLTQYTERYDLSLGISRSDWDSFMASSDRYYIEQIAVPKSYAKQGIGTALLQASQKLSPKGLMAAILFEPYNNRASYALFTQKGHFDAVGSLDLKDYPGFRDLKSSMMMWPSPLRMGQVSP